MNKKSLLALMCCFLMGVPSIVEARRGGRHGGYHHGGRRWHGHGGYRRGYWGGPYYRRSWWPFWGTGIYVTSTANQREIDELRARVAELEAELDAADRTTRHQYRREIRSLNDRIAKLEAQQR